MPYEDLRRFLGKLEENGELVRVTKEVDPQFEIGAICRKMELMGGPAILFEKVKGYDMPLVANILGSRNRVALALETTDIKSAIAKVEDVIYNQKYISPVMVENAPCQEVVLTGDDVDITKLPVPIWNEKDGGRYFTAAYQIAKEPDSGVPNLSLHRMQIKGPRKTGILAHPPVHLGLYRQKAEERNQALEIAVCIGVDPIIELAAMCPIPMNQNEFALAGGIRGEAVQMVKCKTVDLEVPATAEIVLEGRILPGNLEYEGPFGEYTGYYGPGGERHIVEYTAITYRKKPIFRGLYISKPPTEAQFLLELGRSSVLLHEIRHKVPTVTGAWIPVGGCGGFNAVISIRKLITPDYPYATDGWGKLALTTALSSHLRIKNVIVVDQDVDIFNTDEVEWALATRFQADRDLVIIPKTTGFPLDPSQLDTRGLTCGMGLDATIPLNVDYPEVPYPPQKVMDRVEDNWEEYGFKRIY